MDQRIVALFKRLAISALLIGLVGCGSVGAPRWPLTTDTAEKQGGDRTAVAAGFPSPSDVGLE